MSRALQVLREERSLLQKQLSAVNKAIAALSGPEGLLDKGSYSSPFPPKAKKHGRVWTPAMRAVASKRAKARWAKKK
jgi:hypothetical protein